MTSKRQTAYIDTSRTINYTQGLIYVSVPICNLYRIFHLPSTQGTTSDSCNHFYVLIKNNKDKLSFTTHGSSDTKQVMFSVYFTDQIKDSSYGKEVLESQDRGKDLTRSMLSCKTIEWLIRKTMNHAITLKSVTSSLELMLYCFYHVRLSIKNIWFDLFEKREEYKDEMFFTFWFTHPLKSSSGFRCFRDHRVLGSGHSFLGGTVGTPRTGGGQYHDLHPTLEGYKDCQQWVITDIYSNSSNSRITKVPSKYAINIYICVCYSISRFCHGYTRKRPSAVENREATVPWFRKESQRYENESRVI